MSSDELRLLAATAALAPGHTPRHAVILDFSGVLHIDEPVFRDTLARWLAGEDKDATGGPPVELFQLAHGRMVLLIPDERLAERRAALAQVAARLEAHARGLPHAEWFSLSREPERFADAVRLLVAEGLAGDHPEAPPASDDLDRFLAMERSLHAVDLSSLVRQSVVYRLLPGGGLEPDMLEMTVSLAAVGRLFGIDLSASPWLYDRVTALLDRRMLYHLLRDHDEHALPVAVKLHAATVAGSEFAAIMTRLPARWAGRLVVELPHVEWQADRAGMVAAITAARQAGLGLALDHVPLDVLGPADLPEVDWYRIPWTRDDGSRIDLSKAADALAHVGPGRCILARCTDPRAVRDARAAGIPRVEGPAANDLARLGEGEDAPEREVTLRPDNRKAPEAADSAPPEPPGLLSRLAGWLHPAQPPPGEPAKGGDEA